MVEPPRATRPVIAVAGNMGSGKSSLVAWLCHEFGMVPFFEPHEENPYLADFYGDMERHALGSQLFFLVRRYRIHREIAAQASEGAHLPPLVQDRTIYEDAEIFAEHLHRRGAMSDRDHALYRDFYETLREELAPPELLIYLRCPRSTLSRRIRSRGRAYEQAIPASYLRALEELYEAWIEQYDRSPKLVIDTSRLDYVERLFDRLEVKEALRVHLDRWSTNERTASTRGA